MLTSEDWQAADIQASADQASAHTKEQLARFQGAYEAIFKMLRSEKGFRESMLRRASSEHDRDYWQGRIADASEAINALITMKDIGKLALLRTVPPGQATPAQFEQLALVDEAPKRVEFK